MKNITVLITGAGAPGAPGIIKSLRKVKKRKIKIIGVDARKSAVGSVLADKFVIIPLATEKEYISSLFKVAKKFNTNVVLPLNTDELVTLSENRELFTKQGINVSISPPESLKIANNKYLLMKEMKGKIPVPKFYLTRNIREFKETVNRLGYPKTKVCFKPPMSRGLRGFRILDPQMDRLDLLLNQKPIGTVTVLEEILPVLQKAKLFPEFLVMEYLPGKEFSVDALADNGKPLMVIPRTRDYIKMGISFEGTLVKDEEIIKYSEEIVRQLKLNGNVGFQFKKDKNGIPKLLECNPRLQGTVVINTFAGANLVYLAVKSALGEKIKTSEKMKWGTKMIRYWEEVYKYPK